MIDFARKYIFSICVVYTNLHSNMFQPENRPPRSKFLIDSSYLATVVA